MEKIEEIKLVYTNEELPITIEEENGKILGIVDKNKENNKISMNIIKDNIAANAWILDYIESTGTQYIDTKITGNYNNVFEFTFQPMSNSGDNPIIGSREKISTKEQIMWYNTNIKQWTNRLYHSDNQLVFQKYMEKTKIKTGLNKINIDGIEYPQRGFDYGDNGIDLILFGLRTEAKVDTRKAKMKLYDNFKISRNADILINLLPVEKNNIVQMYDIVTNTYFTNQGTGEFLGGNKVGYISEGIAYNMDGTPYQEKNIIKDKVVQFDDATYSNEAYAIVECEKDIELTRCGKNLFDYKRTISPYVTFIEDGYETTDYIINYSNKLNLPRVEKKYTFTRDIEYFGDIIPSGSLNSLRYIKGSKTVYFNGTPDSGNWVNKKQTVSKSSTLSIFDGETGLVCCDYGSSNKVKVALTKGQLELGETATNYEPYNGDTFTLKANKPIKVPLLQGTNTFFPDSDVNIKVTYFKDI